MQSVNSLGRIGSPSGRRVLVNTRARANSKMWLIWRLYGREPWEFGSEKRCYSTQKVILCGLRWMTGSSLPSNIQTVNLWRLVTFRVLPERNWRKLNWNPRLVSHCLLRCSVFYACVIEVFAVYFVEFVLFLKFALFWSLILLRGCKIQTDFDRIETRIRLPTEDS